MRSNMRESPFVLSISVIITLKYSHEKARKRRAVRNTRRVIDESIERENQLWNLRHENKFVLQLFSRPAPLFRNSYSITRTGGINYGPFICSKLPALSAVPQWQARAELGCHIERIGFYRQRWNRPWRCNGTNYMSRYLHSPAINHATRENECRKLISHEYRLFSCRRQQQRSLYRHRENRL